MPTTSSRRLKLSPVVELRCERHLHGVAVGQVITIKCAQCTRANGGEPVVHRWQLTERGLVMLKGKLVTKLEAW